MRRLFTTVEARHRGLTSDALRWGTRTGRWQRIERGVYGLGPDPPSPLDRARARVLAANGVAGGTLAGMLFELDGVELEGPLTRRRKLAPNRTVVIGGIRCADALQTLVDLAATLEDSKWEQALESALRKRLATVPELEALLPVLGRARVAGTSRIRRVLALRPPGAPATESLLETLMVQLIRTVPDVPDPIRQLEICDDHGVFVARVDLAWPDLGLFVELDGQGHADQPVYDARRETAVVAATGWLCGRFTWTEVVRLPTTTSRRLAALVRQARKRPLA